MYVGCWQLQWELIRLAWQRQGLKWWNNNFVFHTYTTHVCTCCKENEVQREVLWNVSLIYSCTFHSQSFTLLFDKTFFCKGRFLTFHRVHSVIKQIYTLDITVWKLRKFVVTFYNKNFVKVVKVTFSLKKILRRPYVNVSFFLTCVLGLFLIHIFVKAMIFMKKARWRSY